MLARKVAEDLFTPIGDMVAIHVYKAGESEGGVLIPEDARGIDAVMARAVSVGPECKQVEKGDLLVMFPNVIATKIRYKGTEYLMLPEKVIGGVVHDDDKDLDRLARKAEANSIPSQSKLARLAEAAGMTKKQIDAAESWDAVVTTIRKLRKEAVEPLIEKPMEAPKESPRASQN